MLASAFPSLTVHLIGKVLPIPKPLFFIVDDAGTDHNDINTLVVELLQHLEQSKEMFSNGFDCEWKVAYQPNPPPRLDVIQLALYNF